MPNPYQYPSFSSGLTASRYATPGGVDPELDREIARTKNPKTMGVLQAERANQITTTAGRQKDIDSGFDPNTGIPLPNPPTPVGMPPPMSSSDASALDRAMSQQVPAGYQSRSPLTGRFPTRASDVSAVVDRGMDTTYPVGYQGPEPLAPQPAYKPNTPVDMSVADASIKKYRANNPVGPPDTTNWPQFTGALADSDRRMSEAFARGDTSGGVARGIAGALGAVPAAAVDYYNQRVANATPVATGARNFLSELTSGWIPRADAAAKTAAAKEVGSTNTPLAPGDPKWNTRSGDSLDYPPLNAPATAPPAPAGGSKGTPESDASNAKWNAFVQSQLGSLNAAPAETGVGPGAMPTWTKQAGEAAIAAGGAPRNLDYGYGTAIVGSGAGSKGQFNTFTGVGQGKMPAGGAGVYGRGGVPGGGGTGDPYDMFRSHIADVMAQHEDAFNEGTTEGMLKARALRSYLGRLGPLAQEEAQRQYQMGQLGVSQGHLSLEQQRANADIAIRNLVAAKIGAGKLSDVGAMARAQQGQGIAAPRRSVSPFTWDQNLDTEEDVWRDWPQQKK